MWAQASECGGFARTDRRYARAHGDCGDGDAERGGEQDEEQLSMQQRDAEAKESAGDQ
jgi:hypothetical protein